VHRAHVIMVAYNLHGGAPKSYHWLNIKGFMRRNEVHIDGELKPIGDLQFSVFLSDGENQFYRFHAAQAVKLLHLHDAAFDS
jgi:hypothetical protein